MIPQKKIQNISVWNRTLRLLHRIPMLLDLESALLVGSNPTRCLLERQLWNETETEQTENGQVGAAREAQNIHRRGDSSLKNFGFSEKNNICCSKISRPEFFHAKHFGWRNFRNLIHYLGKQAVDKNLVFAFRTFWIWLKGIAEFLEAISSKNFRAFKRSLRKHAIDVFGTFLVIAKCGGNHENLWYWPLKKSRPPKKDISKTFGACVVEKLWHKQRAFLSKLFVTKGQKNTARGPSDI